MDSEQTRTELVEELGTLRSLVTELKSQATYQRDSEDTRQTVTETERLFRQFADNASEVFCFWSADRRELLYVSPAYETIWGRSVASLYANPHAFVDTIHPDDREVVVRDITAQLSGTFNDPFVQKYRVVSPDHSVRKRFRAAGCSSPFAPRRWQQGQFTPTRPPRTEKNNLHSASPRPALLV